MDLFFIMAVLVVRVDELDSDLMYCLKNGCDLVRNRGCQGCWLC